MNKLALSIIFLSFIGLMFTATSAAAKESNEEKVFTAAKESNEEKVFTAWNVNLNQTVIVPKESTYPQTTLQDYPCFGPGIDGQGKQEDLNKEYQMNPEMAHSDALGMIASEGMSHMMYMCGLEH